jgi:hypothetical protein
MFIKVYNYYITLEDEKLKEYTKLVRKISKMGEANESGTLGYHFYFNRDETKCVVHETFANSDLVIAQNDSFASQTMLPRILSVSET